tara:strand:- start:101 stop:202 length:102 start_codon:yes stop_codon:yes gene_type:complete
MDISFGLFFFGILVPTIAIIVTFLVAVDKVFMR